MLTSSTLTENVMLIARRKSSRKLGRGTTIITTTATTATGIATWPMRLDFTRPWRFSRPSLAVTRGSALQADPILSAHFRPS